MISTPHFDKKKHLLHDTWSAQTLGLMFRLLPLAIATQSSFRCISHVIFSVVQSRAPHHCVKRHARIEERAKRSCRRRECHGAQNTTRSRGRIRHSKARGGATVSRTGADWDLCANAPPRTHPRARRHGTTETPAASNGTCKPARRRTNIWHQAFGITGTERHGCKTIQG